MLQGLIQICSHELSSEWLVFCHQLGPQGCHLNPGGNNLYVVMVPSSFGRTSAFRNWNGRSKQLNNDNESSHYAYVIIACTDFKNEHRRRCGQDYTIKESGNRAMQKKYREKCWFRKIPCPTCWMITNRTKGCGLIALVNHW